MAPVGQTSMQAPQNSHPDSNSDVPWEVPIRLRPDLWNRVMASSPRISSQARTHREQTMHRFMSISQ